MGGPGYVDGLIIQEFDNFEYTPFIYNGKEYISSEQAYQASKFIDQNYAEQIRLTKQSHRIYEMGQTKEYKIKPNFDRKRIMYKIICAKLIHNKNIAKLLLLTQGDITFPESDEYWGSSKNILGKIYMKIRKKLRK